MKLEENDVIIINFRKPNIAPIIKKKEWFEKNKTALNVDGWRLPTKEHLKDILKENEIEPYKKERKPRKVKEDVKSQG
jgi:spermidine synthase